MASAEAGQVVIPIIYGNLSIPLKSIPEFAHANPDFTHKWTLYVRGLDPTQDISPFVSKVIFKLHDSFAVPLRIVEKYPFEISELGWGEFEVNIKVFLRDTIAKPLNFTHFLRLYPSEEGTYLPQPPVDNLSISVIAESYDEIVISSSSLVQTMKKAGVEKLCTPASLDRNSHYYLAEKDELDRLSLAKTKILAEIDALREKRQLPER